MLDVAIAEHPLSLGGDDRLQDHAVRQRQLRHQPPKLFKIIIDDQSHLEGAKQDSRLVVDLDRRRAGRSQDSP